MFRQIIERNRLRRARTAHHTEAWRGSGDGVAGRLAPALPAPVRLSSALAPWANWLFFPMIVATMFWIAAFFARDTSLPLWVRIAVAAAFAWAGMAGIATNFRQWRSVSLLGEHLIVRQYLSTKLVPLTCIETAELHRTPQGLPLGVLTLRTCCQPTKRELIFPARDGRFPPSVLTERLARIG